LARKQSLPIATKRSVVRRGGATQRNWYGETREIEVGTDWEETKKHLSVRFSLPCSGGSSQIAVQISPTDFTAIVKAMVAADSKAALNAIAKELGFAIAKISN
jgi:hypothetical protein